MRRVVIMVGAGIWAVLCLWLLLLTHPRVPPPSGVAEDGVERAEPRAGSVAPRRLWPEARRQPLGVVRPATGEEGVLSGAPAGAAAAASVAAGEDVIPDEYVLRFYHAADRAAFVRMARELGGLVIVDELGLGHAIRVRGKREVLERAFARGPRPIWIENNIEMRAPPTPPAPPAELANAYRAIGDGLLPYLGVAGGNAGWGRGVTIAVLDTAIARQAGLPEGQITRITLDGVVESGGKMGHGTAVASLILGAGPGIPGLAPEARVLGLAVMSGDGKGDGFTLARGIVEAVNRGADIINLSLGSYGDSKILRDALRYAMDRGVLIVAAVGNDGDGRIMYPARYPGVIAVGAADAQGRHLPFSNSGSEVDLLAPGLGLHAAGMADGRVAFTGTSAAAPVVSGALAALMSQQRELTAAAAAQFLIAYANDGGAPGVDAAYGGGVMDLGRVLERERGGIHDVAVVAPYVPLSERTDGAVRVQFYAQNRGTETLEQVRLQVRIGNGSWESQSYTDVRVGDVLVRDVVIPAAAFVEGAGVVVEHRAEIYGRGDHRPHNNAMRSVLQRQP